MPLCSCCRWQGLDTLLQLQILHTNGSQSCRHLRICGPALPAGDDGLEAHERLRNTAGAALEQGLRSFDVAYLRQRKIPNLQAPTS